MGNGQWGRDEAHGFESVDSALNTRPLFFPLPIAYCPLPLTTMISSSPFRSILGTVHPSAG